VSTRWERVVVWFRRDLRVADHPALTEAASAARSVVPLFVMDPRLLDGPGSAPARSWFVGGALDDLDRSLRERGGRLIVRGGRAEDVVPAVAAEIGAEAVLATRDVTPFSHRRDRAVHLALERDGRTLHLRPGLLLVEPEDLLTAEGTAYSVFSPFWRSLQRMPRRTPLDAPASIPPLPDGLDRLGPAGPSSTRPPLQGLPEPGEQAARRRLESWVRDGLADYASRRNELSGDGTSRLSADLHLGLLSPVQVEAASAGRGASAAAFVRQIGWREFYHHLLFHRRTGAHVRSDPLMGAFRSEADDPEAVAAWREGRTGVPVVDAAMRQLAASGWMSNRARLVVASFLTRHLLMDYRIGERHFLRHLVDGDVANNGGGWRWTAGVGSDPQPWFRIMNPVLQGRRFDPDGTWVRRWVPELASVPDRSIHAPWEMSADEAAEAGVGIRSDYPRPVVGIVEGRERALAAFRAAKG
jgi:deoxyribodipyrimidine photo-lyase